MTMREMVKSIAEKTALTQVQTAEVVDLALESIAATLLEEGRMELRNFGIFSVKHRKARKARDPRTGETMHVPARFTAVFKPGQAFEHRLARLRDLPGSH